MTMSSFKALQDLILTSTIFDQAKQSVYLVLLQKSSKNTVDVCRHRLYFSLNRVV